jgi:hypothetical protein
MVRSGFCSQGLPRVVAEWPAVLCHDTWENIFTSERIITKFYQNQYLMLKMDVRTFLDSVANERIEKSTNVHWVNMQNC